MWRDRTNLYISYRQSYAHHPNKRTRYSGAGGSGIGGRSPFSDSFPPVASSSGLDDDRRGLLSAGAFDDVAGGSAGFGDGDAVIEMDVLPPRWADIGDEINEILDGVARKSAQLERLHQRHVLPGFNDDDNNSAKKAEEGEIERLTQDITKGFHDCHRRIQRIEQMVREAKQAGTLSKADEVMAKNIQISLAGRVQDSSARFRSKQSAYLKKLRGMGGFASPTDRSSTPLAGSSAAGAAGVGITYSTDPSLLESDADKSFSQSTLAAASRQRQQHLQTGANDIIIARREREIEDIAQGIIELADLFRDLQTMVIDQGTMLDRIDYNVERMNTDVKEAEKELVVATRYQKKTTKRMAILLLILVVIGLIILLVIKPKRHRGGDGQMGDVSGGDDMAGSVPGDRLDDVRKRW